MTSAPLPSVSIPDELFEKFDGRMSREILVPFIEQLSNWPEARDLEGRTMLMVALACTRGRTPELYLQPKAQECLTAVDGTGRNLWSYFLNYRHTFLGSDFQWQEVFDQVPRQFNPVSGRGLLTDHILNPSGFSSNCTKRFRRNSNELDLLMKSLNKVLDWVGPGVDLWWRCRDRDEQKLFDALITRSMWAQWTSIIAQRGSPALQQGIDRTLEPGKTAHDLPTPFRAFFCTLTLMTSTSTAHLDEALEQVRAGLLDPFMEEGFSGFETAILKGDAEIRNSAAHQNRQRLPVGEWLSVVKERRFDQQWPQPEAAAVKRPRL